MILLLLTAGGFGEVSASDWSEAQEAFSAKRWEEAVAALERVLERSPALAHAHFLLGLSLTELGRRDEGLAAVRVAVELDEGTPQYRLHLAQLLLGLGRGAEAADALADSSAETLAPPLDRAYVALLAKAAADLPDAGARLRSAIEQLGDRQVTAPLWRALGRVESDASPRAAYDAYLRAFRLEDAPADADRAIELATAAAATSEPPERLEWSSLAADAAELRLSGQDPQDPELALLAGRLRLQAEQPALARPLLEQAASGAPTSADPEHELARCAVALDEPEAALAHLDEALTREADAEQRARSWALRASILHERGRLREAADAYARAGRSDQAALLREAVEADDAARRDEDRCRALRAEIDQALSEAAGVVGPRDLKELEARAARRLTDAGCSDRGA